MSELPDDQTFEQLAAGYFDQTLTQAELARFQQLLHADDACVRRFAELAQLNQMIGQEAAYRQRNILVAGSIDPEDSSDTRAARVLAELARLEGAAEAEPVVLTPPQHKPMRARRQEPDLSPREIVSVTGYLLGRALTTRPALLACTAALVLLAAVLLIPWGGEPSPQTAQQQTPNATPPPAPVAVATLTDTHDAQWAAFKLAAGDTLYAKQRLTLTEGFAEITTNRGAVAILEAPATIRLLDHNALRLETGKLVGICETESSKGFIVGTPHMDITDLGTRFGVDATRSDATEVHVFNGEVEVASATASTIAQRLLTGQSARADATGNAITTIDHAPARFAAMTPVKTILPGTGVGLAVGESDPAWVVVAKEGKPLPVPKALSVSDAEGHILHLPNAPERSQWLAWTPEDDSQIEKTTYRIRTTINVPDHIDPATAYLTIQFAADNHLVGLRVNESPVEFQAAEPKPVWERHKLEPIEVRGDLMAGTNTIEFEIVNFPPRAGRSGVKAGLRVEWQLHGTTKLFNQAINR